MKKKAMRAIFIALFILGFVVGFLIPWDFRDVQEKVNEKKLSANIYNIPNRLGQLDKESPYFKYSVLAELDTGSVELARVDEKIPLHKHPNENHFVYVYKGKAKGTVGSMTWEVGPGQMVAIPAGVPHSFERIGDTPVELILFSTPPFMPNDTIWLEESK